MIKIETVEDWHDACDMAGPFNLRRLKFLAFVAETRGWQQAASRLAADIELLEAVENGQQRANIGWSVSSAPTPPECGWGIEA